ncbi:hypothetical protein [Natronohydrobacter thiooxidans]|uniref:hypothetical protein n=1 Tax=Natronohydrobacter thiooxidans TaxID=87172 RepID=UPI0008FF29F5|nr:hypothetical protein [Natronohydrobacter thiooxidans]
MRKNQQSSKTPSRLRRDIDAGEGRDKIAFPDPAAAPLGTDDEAAGAPVTDRQARIAHQHEIQDRSDRDLGEAQSTHLGPPARQGRGSKLLQPRLGPLLLALALVIAILFVVVLVFM